MKNKTELLLKIATLGVPAAVLVCNDGWLSIIGAAWSIAGWYAYWDIYPKYTKKTEWRCNE